MQPRGARSGAIQVDDPPEADASQRVYAEQLRALLAVLPDRTFLVTRDCRVLEAHFPAGLAAHFSRGDMIGRDATTFVPPEAREFARAAVRAVADTGQPALREFVVPADELGDLHFEVRLARAHADTVVALVRDITDRKRAEASLRASEERNRALLAVLPDRVTVLSSEGVIQEFHGQRVATRHADEELIGHNQRDFVDAATGQRVAEAMARALKEQRTEVVHFDVETLAGVMSFEASLTPYGPDRVLTMTRDVTARKTAERELRSSDERFRRLLSSIPDIVFEFDTNLKYAGAYGGYLRDIGRTEADFLGKGIGDIVEPALAEMHEQKHREALGGQLVTYEWTLGTGPDGVHFLTKISPVRAADGTVTGVVGVGRDITEQRRNQEALLQQKELYETLLKTQSDIGEALIVGSGETFHDWANGLIYRNAAASVLTGYSEEELSKVPIRDLVAPEERRVFMARVQIKADQLGDHFETILLSKDGRRVPVEIAWRRFNAGARVGIMALVRDISERARAREELEHQAFFDALTDLPNRSLLQDRLRQALAASRRTGEPIALLLLDLNRFKEVNDTFGHAAGDTLLREVAVRLKKEFRETDTLSRLGGDEFSIVLPGNDLAAAQVAARRIIRALEHPIVVQSQSMEVGASIGIAVSPEHGTDPDALLRHADVAMYAAKRQGLGFSVYEPSHDQSSAARLTMTAELRQAIEERQLVLHYQPQLNVGSSRVVGVEALVRWEHPTRGVLPPSEFIPLAEETGLIRPLLTSVLELALRQCQRIHATHPGLVMAVNISMRNLVDPGLPEIIERLISEAGVPPGLLELELTESAIMTDAQRAIEILGRLRSLGLRLTIDDFGTGHSSLAYLHRLPLNCVKIDKSFVTNVRRDESSAAIVRSTIDLAHNLKFAVVAEGVEDGAVLDYLAELGCDIAQGYYISRALPADVLPVWLQQHER